MKQKPLKPGRTLSTLRQADTRAQSRFSIGGIEKEGGYARKPITLPTLETKRELDREIFGARIAATSPGE